MDAHAEEIEAKFVVPGLDPIRQRLSDLSARPIRPRQQEANLRFDLPNARLRQARQVLRLRVDDEARLTFKGPGADVERRQEIEVVVSDAAGMQRLLEALGFQLVFVYEKFRETFRLGPAQVMLDELPFGPFIEIEGEELDQVEKTAGLLTLPWPDRLPVAYLDLFERLRRLHGWAFRDATFANFSGLPPVSFEEVRAAAANP